MSSEKLGVPGSHECRRATAIGAGSAGGTGFRTARVGGGERLPSLPDPSPDAEVDSGPKIVWRSAAQRALLEMLRKVASTDAEILITGPTGVGKELYAQYAHACSRRSKRPFVAVNCSNLSNDLLENEIFGHTRGAYTGAHGPAAGMVSAADGGTMFLDEIDTLSATCQAKLLRFVQSKEYRPLGGTAVMRADIRFVAASNADLPERVRCGTFREDLFFRLCVVPIQVTPLAERPDDVAPLIEHFVTRYAAEYNVSPVSFAASSRSLLLRYPWPGNVRELENCVRYLTCIRLERPVELDDLPLRFGRTDSTPTDDVTALPLKEAKEQLISEFEKLYLARALERARGNVSAASRASGKHRRAFFELMRKYGIEATSFRQ
jgi:two-component system response regulator GlrR